MPFAAKKLDGDIRPLPLEVSISFPGSEYDPIDQANACLFLASDMGKHIKGQVIQILMCNFLDREI